MRTRHLTTALLNEQEAYLCWMMDRGISDKTVLSAAKILLSFVDQMELKQLRPISRAEVERSIHASLPNSAIQKHMFVLARQRVVSWLRFHHVLAPAPDRTIEH